MKNLTKASLLATFGLAGALIALPAQASFSWTIDRNSTQGSCEAASVGNKCQSSDAQAGQLVTLTATGWASSRSGDTASKLEQATLGRYDGIGVSAQGEGREFANSNLAADNQGKLESILYSFSSGGSPIDVVIESVTQGWHRDADFSLLAYTGQGVAPANPGDLSNRSYDDLTSNGWQLVSNNTYHEPNSSWGTDITASDDANNNYETSNLNAGKVQSSHWLVAVLNGSFWNHSNYIGNDYIAVKTITGTAVAAVSTPSTAPLLVIAMAALGFLRRKRSTSATLEA
ncbi:MAG: hypothetical protein AB8B81_16835 [Halioglobus sp.]